MSRFVRSGHSLKQAKRPLWDRWDEFFFSLVAFILAKRPRSERQVGWVETFLHFKTFVVCVWSFCLLLICYDMLKIVKCHTSCFVFKFSFWILKKSTFFSPTVQIFIHCVKNRWVSRSRCIVYLISRQSGATHLLIAPVQKGDKRSPSSSLIFFSFIFAPLMCLEFCWCLWRLVIFTAVWCTWAVYPQAFFFFHVNID